MSMKEISLFHYVQKEYPGPSRKFSQTNYFNILTNNLNEYLLNALGKKLLRWQNFFVM